MSDTVVPYANCVHDRHPEACPSCRGIKALYRLTTPPAPRPTMPPHVLMAVDELFKLAKWLDDRKEQHIAVQVAAHATTIRAWLLGEEGY